ncbi:methyl-accepting chemotaxis protein [Clostridium fermenticellae]|uniref:Methyl-accepting chemotaxis protein n=1 Tax=Clostridium fermenticellae TaxID=2068654 RepID=A0A386H2K7_9CLOT|nr:methyl-accepting chemotaxis protein [Clostridium fermenticellae]AYD39929.1 methyl-accepting chemotaxis protein [Clostridium fermenticellae]
MRNNAILKKSVKFKILRIPIIIIFVVVALIACMSIYEVKSKILLQMETDGLVMADHVSSEIERNNSSIDELNGSIDTRVKTLSSFLNANMDKANDDYLTLLSKQFEVNEINIADPSGKTIYTNLPTNVGYVYDSKTDAYRVLKGEKNFSMEDIRKSTLSNDYYKYGSMRLDNGGIVQIGILANAVQKLTSNLEMQNFMQSLVKDKSVVYAAFIGSDLKIKAHSDKTRVGITVNDIGSKTAAAHGKTYSSQYKYENKIPVYDVLVPVSKNGKTIGAVDLGMSMENVNKTVRMITILIIVLALAAFLIAVFMLTKVSKSITSPLDELVIFAKKIEDGDLNNEIDIKSEDEIGVLARSFKNMGNGLKDTIASIKENSEKVQVMSNDLNTNAEHMTSAANEVSGAVQEVAEGTTKQSEDLVSISESMERLGEEIQNIFDKLSHVEETSNITKDKADNGKKEINILLKSITDVKDSFEEVVKKINNLDKSVSKVGGITEVINDISEQTNLLALNAAIEASRAGEAGRGFSVVAEEVRTLAEQSQQSTAEIQELIQSISNETKNVISTSSKVKGVVQDQSSIVDSTMKSFDEMSESIDKIKPLVDDAYRSIKVTNESKDSISGKIESVTAVSEETSASSEEIAASSEEMFASSENVAKFSGDLKKVVNELEQKISRFKI